MSSNCEWQIVIWATCGERKGEHAGSECREAWLGEGGNMLPPSPVPGQLRLAGLLEPESLRYCQTVEPTLNLGPAIGCWGHVVSSSDPARGR